MNTRQKPIGSGFGAKSGTSDVLGGKDLRGKLALVTGGYAGIGLATTRALVGAGAKVIVPARTRDKAEAALRGLEGVEIDTMELSEPASVDAFVRRFLASDRALHLLIDNAGIMATPESRDARGYELQLSTNHLGHYQLTTGLWPALRRARGARVVTVSSAGHRYSSVHFDDPNFERRPYDRWLAYGQSKTANVLSAVAWDARGEVDGIRAFALHPGAILTDLARHMSQDELRAAGAVDDEGKPITDPKSHMKTPDQGASTTIWCATSTQLDGMGGVYAQDCDLAPIVSPEEQSKHSVEGVRDPIDGVMPWAIDPEAAERLVALSERLLGRV